MTTATAPALPATNGTEATTPAAKRPRAPGQDIASKIKAQTVSLQGVEFAEPQRFGFKGDSAYKKVVLAAANAAAGQGVAVDVPEGIKPNKVVQALNAAIKNENQKGKLYTRVTKDGKRVFVMRSSS